MLGACLLDISLTNQLCTGKLKTSQITNSNFFTSRKGYTISVH